MYSNIISSLENKITLTVDNVILELQKYFIVKKYIGKSINKCPFEDVCNSIGMALGSNISDNDIKEHYYNLYKKIDELNKKEILELLDEVKKRQKHRWSDSAIIPKEFLDIMFREMDKTKEVFLFEIEKYGSYVYDYIEKFKEYSIYITCLNENNLDFYKNVLGFNNAIFIKGSIFDPDFISKKFDLIVSFPSIGVRIDTDNNDLICRDSCVAYTQMLLYYLKEDGALRIILPSKVSFAGGQIASFREYINNNYKINLIYSLTSNVFKPNVMINTYYIEFTTGRTEGIEAKIIDKDKDGLIFEKSEKLILKEELEEINNWHIDLLMIKKSNEMLAYENSQIRKECIRDIAMVLKGKTITRKDDNGNIKVINISNLNDGEIDYSDLESISDDLIKNSRYILENGDILVSARGTIIKIGVFKQQNFVCIASSNLNIIRCNKEIDSMYLKIFLESHVGKELLKSIERGSNLLNINYKDIEEIKVPVLSYTEQKEIVDEYVKAKNSYNAMVEEATKEWEFAKGNVERKFYR